MQATTHSDRARLSWATLIVLVALALSVSACGPWGATQGSGTALIETLDLDLSGVRSVEVKDAWDAEIRQGSPASVEITIDDNLRDNVRIDTSGSTVTIDSEGSFQTVVGLNVVVTLPTVEGLTVADASSVVADELSLTNVTASDASSVNISTSQADELRVEASDASTVTMSSDAAQVDVSVSDASDVILSSAATQVAISVSDGSSVTMSGSATQVDVSAEDGSSADLSDLEAVDAIVDAHDGSGIEVRATGTVSGSANDGSDIVVLGGAAIDVSTSDGSSVQRG